MKQKIYCAGPQVFIKDKALEVLEKHKKLCEDNGFEGLIPFDANVNFSQSNEKIRKDIHDANYQMIRECDIVVADLSSFRGSEPDSGTVAEVGAAKILNKRVIIYSNDEREYVEKVKDHDKNTFEYNGFTYDSNNMMIEGLGARFNIMLNEDVEYVYGNFESVIEYLVGVRKFNKKIKDV